MASEDSASIPEQVRTACAWVAGEAGSVRVVEEAVPGYAAGIEPAADPDSDSATQYLDGGPEGRASFAICLNAINFGSGWWPTIRKRPGHSGFTTVAAGLTERFREHRPWTAEELTRLNATDLAAILYQDYAHPLMAQFAASLRDVGAHLLAEHGGRFIGPAETARTLPELATAFAAWEAFADVSLYRERPVPFFKRAQLAAADLCRAGVADLPGLNRLTAFADNLVPHVLRLDGVLTLDPSLTERIEAGQLLDHGSPEEVELRAGAVHAVELLASHRPDLTSAEIDAALWNRGRASRYKAVPRPRSRNTAY